MIKAISKESGLGTITIVSVLFIIVLTVFALAWRVLCVTNVENHEFAFNYNRLTGKIEPIDRAGWITRMPFVNSVHTIDLRPYQISITADIQRNIGGSSVGSRVLNAKLVRFNPSGLTTFIEWHGRGAGDSRAEMLEILKAYAFNSSSGKDCPFLTIVDELSPKNSSNAIASTNIVLR